MSSPTSASVLLNRLLARGKFRHVQVLLQLAELGSVQRAAEAVGMTQSSVTQTLASLERLLDMPLFLRHARGVRPTPACADLLPVIRHLMAGVAESAEVLSAHRAQGQQSVRLFASASAAHGLLVNTLTAFAQRHPAIQVHLSEAEGEDILLAVARGEADLVACRRPRVIPEGWGFETLLEDSFAVVCAADHRLARRRRVRWEDLGRETWLMSPVGTAARIRFDELAAAFRAPPAIYPVVTRMLTPTWRLLRDQPILAFLPRSFVRHLLDAGQLVQLPVQAPLQMAPLGLLVPRAHRAAVEPLIAHLRASAAAAVSGRRAE